MKKRPQATKSSTPSTKQALFEQLNASAERTLQALMNAYEAGMKEGLTDAEEDQLIEILRRAKRLRDEVRQVTEEPPTSNRGSGRQSEGPSPDTSIG